ncbi:UDP-glucuronosyltransferase 2B13 [Zootermopsis nevadensis]|uniref:UDP-glucuronosyltransferase n=2 Tax=Zootermopsis nevadensis TaxID=136037 RepID=A0A067RAP7_ZOONE|nr:UDP-glucuronosyltransferase 2B13 [Zootermopsis nevadensis]
MKREFQGQMAKSALWCLCLPVLLFLLLVPQDVSCARFLVIIPTSVKSHFLMLEKYMKALADRGHELVVVSRFPQIQPISNYVDIVLEGSLNGSNPKYTLSIEQALFIKNPVVNAMSLAKYGALNCGAVLNDPSVKQLINSDEKFDVVVNDCFHTDCFLPFAYKFGAISICASTSVLMPWANDRMGNPDNPSYIPNLFTSYSERMNFVERVINAVTTVLHKVAYHFISDCPSQLLARKFFGEDTPDLADLARNISLLLVNSHFSVNAPRPLVPGVVEIGGMHIPKPKPLPQPLQDYLDGARHGVIYFSFGSLLQAKSFPDDKRFLQAFSELPQRVLWKWEGDTLPGQPENVQIEKWCPQSDILRHPNVLAFVSHGGLLGTLEAAYNGVPVVGIPFYGDQRSNVAHLKARGMAIQLQYENITKQSVLEALRTVLDQPSYIENARRTARIFRDRPQSALDTAIFWTEYVMRHGGAPHLRSAAVELAWYQYLLLDVIAFTLGTILIFILAVRKFFRVLCSSKNVLVKKKQE